MMILKNKTILITGGGTGIGEALTIQLAEHNQVIICGRNLENLKRVADENTRIDWYQVDLSVPRMIEALFDKLAQKGITLNVLINNAGVVESWDLNRNMLEAESIFNKVNTNYTGAIVMLQKFINQAKRSDQNLMVNITSEVALFPIPILPLYSASKAGLRTFTRALRVQLKGSNFRVVEVLPPGVDTRMPKQLGNTGKLVDPVDFARDMIRMINAGKLEFAPGPNVPILNFFNKFLPNVGLRIIDKMSRRQLVSDNTI